MSGYIHANSPVLSLTFLTFLYVSFFISFKVCVSEPTGCRKPDIPQTVTIKEIDGANAVFGTLHASPTIEWRFDFEDNEEKSLNRLKAFFSLHRSWDEGLYRFRSLQALNLELIRFMGIRYCGICAITFYCTEKNKKTVNYNIYLKIIAVDEFPPKFTRKLIVIAARENSRNGTVLVTLQNYVKDSDASASCKGKDNHYYYFSGGLASLYLRIIDQKKGTIVKLGKLDYEAMPLDKKYFKTAVTVKDDNGHTSRASLKLMVHDVDDEGPVFNTRSFYTAYVPAGYTGPIEIGPKPVKAVDGDSFGADINYFFEPYNGDPVELFLKIDTITGKVRVIRPLRGYVYNVLRAYVVAQEVTRAKHRSIHYFFITRIQGASSLEKKKEHNLQGSLFSTQVIAQCVTLLNVLVLITILWAKLKPKSYSHENKNVMSPTNPQGNRRENE